MSGGNKSGYFFEISWQLIFTKVANIFRYFLGKFEKQLSLRETVVTTIWGTFEKNGLPFIPTSGQTVDTPK